MFYFVATELMTAHHIFLRTVKNIDYFIWLFKNNYTFYKPLRSTSMLFDIP